MGDFCFCKRYSLTVGFDNLWKGKSMSLSKQPYMPLYVRDFLSDERVRKCSAKTIGVLAVLVCMLHLAEEYGHYKLDDPLKEGEKLIPSLAKQLVRSMSFTKNIIESALNELVKTKLLITSDDGFYMPDMVKSNELHEKRSKSGAMGYKAKIQQKTAEATENAPETVQKEEKSADNAENGKFTKTSQSAIELAKNYSSDPKVNELLLEWLEYREAKDMVTTKHNLEKNLEKLVPFAKQSKMSIPDYLCEVIRRGWNNFFVVKPDATPPPKEESSFSIDEFDEFTLGAYIIKDKNEEKSQSPPEW